VRRAVLAIGLGLVLTTVGCAGQNATGQNATGQSATGQPAPAAAPSDEAVPPTLRFQGTSLDGSTLNGADLAGRPVALWFWAPW